MSGFWRPWDTDTANLVADFVTESEGLVLVRELIERGWAPADLRVMYEDPDLDVEQLPTAVTGEELARPAEAAASNPTRRTA